MPRSISEAELKQIQLYRQHLTDKGSVHTVCHDLNGIQAQFMVHVEHRRYFSHYGPATIRDAAYYFGWTQAHTREVLEKLPYHQIEVAGKEHYFCGQLKSDYPDIPRCVLLAGFDQLLLGYQKQDSIYLSPENIRGIFNLTGIVMPAILLEGVVVGRWRKKQAKILFEGFKSISAKNKRYVAATAEKLFLDAQKVEWC